VPSADSAESPTRFLHARKVWYRQRITLQSIFANAA
jgi:hypothetical protein